jgi:type I restriction enzyme, R subunit
MTSILADLGVPGTRTRFEPLTVSDETTVVTRYVPPTNAAASTAYQSEAELEEAFIKQLRNQAYERLRITSEADLVGNLRVQLEKLNRMRFTDSEWDRFFTQSIAAANEGVVEKTRRVQEDHIQILTRDDGTFKNIYLLDKEHIHNNHLQVINQYETDRKDGAKRSTRYDVTILVNGIPMVHIELKRRGVDIREAFNQIRRYQRDSFWAASGLFEYVQLFVISNGTLTKYYSNTTRDAHLAEQASGTRSRRTTSNSFEFTSWWADADNRPIRDLTAFTATFFAKHTLLAVLTRYCVFDIDCKLLVMRPYQIVAAERIIQRIHTATNLKQLGTIGAGGYVWHTTGSGKTLTSYKAAQLASRIPGVEKVVFVVDRKDLDYQTMREYNRFEKGAVDGTTNTAELKRRLEDPNSRIIVTTIQKLSMFVRQNKGHAVYAGHIVLIFDECHRSQFGEMHTAIEKAFKSYHLFGFTGTPIFAENSDSSRNPRLRTTEQAFGERLHTYTVVDAIRDKNVLPFRIDYINTMKAPDTLPTDQVSAIDTEKALLAPERVSHVVGYILDNFDRKTRRSVSYRLGSRRVAGFNSIFATSSIEAAKRYYQAFATVQAERKEADPSYRPLKVGIIYSYAANEEEPDVLIEEEGMDTDSLDASSRDFLDAAIADYNAMFNTSWGTSGDGFEGYYKDLSGRLKNREIDLVIVVNMFLTGFDATTLNTLWVDKNLRSHGLLQAFSRTNRILNSVKTYGNIVTFRDLEQATNDAMALFGNKDAHSIVVLKPYAEYLAEYKRVVAELDALYPLDEPIVGEAAKKDFVSRFGQVLRLRNVLAAFDEFEGDGTMSDRAFQDRRSVYLDIYADFRGAAEGERESINDDIVFEIELVKQVEINVDYILELVARWKKGEGAAAKQVEARSEIARAVDASPSLRSKGDLIADFLDSVSVEEDVRTQWREFLTDRQDEELSRIIDEEGLSPEQARAFMEGAFRDGYVPQTGVAITRILPPASKFSPDGEHAAKKKAVLVRLQAFFDRYFDLR